MGFVPRNRPRKTMVSRQLGKGLPIAVFRWGPVPLPPSKPVAVISDPPRDEIDGEAVLMRTLPRADFRGAFGEQVRLPVRTAETLERFQQELRAVGLVSEGEVFRQGAKDPSYFRVQVRDRKLSAFDIHEASSVRMVEIGAGDTPVDRSNTLGCRSTGVSSKLVSSLDTGDSRPLVHDKRPKGGA